MDECKKEKKGGICFYNCDNIEFMKRKVKPKYKKKILLLHYLARNVEILIFKFNNSYFCSAFWFSVLFVPRSLFFLLIWLSISIIVTLRYKPEVFHNYICPFGALQKLFGKFAFFSRRVDEAVCIGCKKCEKVCPSLAIAVQGENNKAGIETKLCLQCTECIEICPVDAVKYNKGNLS